MIEYLPLIQGGLTMIDILSLIGIGVLVAIFWFIMGIGTARMIVDTDKHKFSLFCIFFWPIVLGIYAYAGDIDL